MVRFRFKKGLRFFQKQICWTLMRRTISGKLIFQSDDGESLSLKDAEVFARLEDHTWQIDEASLSLVGQVITTAAPKDLRALSEQDRAKVTRKLAYIHGARKLLQLDDDMRMLSSPAKLDKVIVAVAAETADPHPPSASTVWRWWKRFSLTQSPLKLADRRRGGGSRKTAEQLRVLEEAVNEVYLNMQKKPITEVVEAVREKIAVLNKSLAEGEQITTPSQATIYRWMRTLYYEVVQAARLGKKVTERELRKSEAGVKVRRLLERVELDHTPLDLILVCDKTKMVLGRPWLTLAIERKSRMILGFYISFHAPSATSILYTLRMAIRPKDDIVAKCKGLRNEWPAFGIFDLLVLDNGMAEHSATLDVVCNGMGIEVLYCAPGEPMEKGAIERLFRTVQEALVHQLPGTVFSNPAQRGDYPAEMKAVLDLDTFTRILVKWIVDDYHVTPHRGLLGKTPLQVWQEEAPHRVIDLPAYPAQLDTMVGTEARRSVFHYGIEFDHLFYNSDALNEIKRRDGGTPKLTIRAYELDVGYIDVLEPEHDEFIRVPAVDAQYAQGLARATHTLIVQEANRRFGKDWGAEQRREVKHEIEKIVEAAVRAKKAASRKLAASLQMKDSERALDTRPADALSTATTPINPQYVSPIPLHPAQPAKHTFEISSL